VNPPSSDVDWLTSQVKNPLVPVNSARCATATRAARDPDMSLGSGDVQLIGAGEKCGIEAIRQQGRGQGFGRGRVGPVC
jgi:hypothetical protein